MKAILAHWALYLANIFIVLALRLVSRKKKDHGCVMARVGDKPVHAGQMLAYDPDTGTVSGVPTRHGMED